MCPLRCPAACRPTALSRPSRPSWAMARHPSNLVRHRLPCRPRRRWYPQAQWPYRLACPSSRTSSSYCCRPARLPGRLVPRAQGVATRSDGSAPARVGRTYAAVRFRIRRVPFPHKACSVRASRFRTALPLGDGGCLQRPAVRRSAALNSPVRALSTIDICPRAGSGGECDHSRHERRRQPLSSSHRSSPAEWDGKRPGSPAARPSPRGLEGGL